jgi:CubicO group peptidase (beta-lactamase class C family)
MKHYLTLALLLLVIPLTTAQTDKRLKGVEKELNELMKATKASGFSVAVVQNDKIIYSAGFGYRDYENKIPADANTLYAIGSSSKAFTCAVLGQLRSEGKLEFTDSPIKYVPELKFYNNDLNGSIIIEDLMCHRTGLPRYDTSWYLFPTHSKDSLIQKIQYMEPTFGLRQQWQYNNFMFALQGVIAEKITGKTWEDNVKERFFTPLGMTRTNASIQEMKQASNASFGYDVKNDAIVKMDYYDIAAMSPAGSINSSVNDMANWVITWINKGKFKGKEILAESYTSDAMSSHAIVGGGLPGKEMPNTFISNYGYGWFISSYKGQYRVEHGGNIDGFSASVAFYPADNIGIIVLTNQNNSSLPSYARNTIADRLLNVKRTDWVAYYKEQQEKGKKQKEEDKKDKDKKEKPKEENHTPSHPIQAYAGLYTNPGYGTFEVTVKNDSLFALLKNNTYYLKCKNYDVFDPFDVKKGKVIVDYEETDGVFFNFSSNDIGDISGLKLKMEPSLDHPIEFKRKPKEVAVAADVVNKYIGDYEIKGMTVKIYLKNDKLYLFVPGQPEYELVATGNNMYVIPTLDGYKAEFIPAENGSIKELKLIQPNGEFIAVKK